MSIIMQATTSTDDREIIECLESLQKTDAGTGFMHERYKLTHAFHSLTHFHHETVFGRTILRGLLEVGLHGRIRNLVC
jgi:meiotically up-regulated gene 157 (Mug157) protein